MGCISTLLYIQIPSFTAYNTTSLPRYMVRSEVHVGKVTAEVWVGQDLASAYRLHPPLCAVPKEQGSRCEVSIRGKVI
jgi:hypothetical protein